MKWDDIKPKQTKKWADIQEEKPVEAEKPAIVPQVQPSMIQQRREAGLEPLMSIASGMVAEPIAGLYGLGSLLTGTPLQEAVKRIKEMRGALTYTPESEMGKMVMGATGEAIKPVAEELESYGTGLGEIGYDIAGPAGGAAGKTIPTALMEAAGLGAARKAAKVGKMPKIPKAKEKAVTKTLIEAAPEVNQIKDASRAIYSELDAMKVMAKPKTSESLMRKVVNRAKKENVDDVLTPKSARVVKQLEDAIENPQAMSVTELDQLRKRAQLAAQSPDPSDARVGAIMVDEVDDFMDKLSADSFVGVDKAKAGKISQRYKDARQLWGRARRAELINEAFEKAGRQASGFENGIRTQLRQLLNNKKRSKFFTKDELAAMDDVVKGSGSQNILKLIGRLGFSEGNATNVLGGLVGMGVLGPVAPITGQISRKLAAKTTREAARKIENLVRGGADGRKITKAYMQFVPKNKRTINELSDLLVSSGSDVDILLDAADKMTREAAEIAKAQAQLTRAEAAIAVSPAILGQENE